MKQRLFRMRRWGVAALAGVTVLGAASVVGEGVASATVDNPTVGAVTPVDIVAGATATAVPSYVLTIPATETVQSGDVIQLTFNPSGGCTTSSNLTVSGTLSAAQTGPTTVATLTATAAPAAGCAEANVITIRASSGASAAGGTITLSGIMLAPSSGATAGADVVTGTWADSPSDTAPTTGAFSVGSDVIIGTSTVTATSPISIVAPATENASIGNLSITPAFSTTLSTGYLCLQLTGATWDATSGAPAIAAQGGATVTSPGSVTADGSSTLVTQGASANFPVTALTPGDIPTFLVSNLHVDVPATGTSGPVTVAVVTGTAVGCATSTALATGTAFVASSAPSAIAGQTPDATTAAEFEAAFYSSGSCTETNGNVVLATSADPYDALAAAYLEAQLGTGILITEPTSLNASTMAAIRNMGVTNVYVVGGPLAISQADITALEATPAYSCGGITATGSMLHVIQAATTGATADNTAALIDSYVTLNAGVNLPSLQAAYSAASSTAGGGIYNDTIGNASASGPVTTPDAKTAIVVSDTDYLDAMTAAGIAYHYKLPVILTTPTALSATAQAELTSLGISQVIAVGGQLALTDAVVTSIQSMNIPVLRIAGQDQTDTAAQLAKFEGAVLGWHDATVLVAQGKYWSDALAAAPLSGGATPESLLLTEGPLAGVGSYTTAVLNTAGTSGLSTSGTKTYQIQVLGGPLAVTSSQTTQMQQALAG